MGKAATVEAVTSPSHKSEAPPLPVDTSSQASMEEAEASLESIPANISFIAAVYSSSSASPSVDPTELQTNANLAADHMLPCEEVYRPQETMSDLGVRATAAPK